MNKLAQQWLDKGESIDVKGHRVFFIDTGGNKPVLCILHGFPTSSFDYHKALPLLSQHFRVIVHDHLGFGASDKPVSYSYSLIEQADIAILLWRQLGVQDVSIFAHDYGTSIATEIMARQPIENSTVSIVNYVLSNGSVYIELAKLRLIQKLLRRPIIGPFIARVTPFSSFKKNIEAIFYDKNMVTNEELESHWAMLIREQGRRVLANISRYSLEREKFWHRWINALKTSQLPVDLIWARNDPIAQSVIATTIQKECPVSQLKWIDDCGHFPMLEKSEEWSENLIQQISIRRSLIKS
ncbi:MAG: alpha/beta hydrolase [Gammaproteobacteria bacterium]|nr:alpha/beta hydrolase [Gammaproteobacteria bacterium]